MAKDVLKVHRLLMKRLRPDIAGKLRDCDVWIGGQHKKFIDKDILLYQLNTALTAIWMSFGMLSQLVPSNDHLAQDCHVMFENVHPFEDGNGRVGRILYNWHRLNMGLRLHIIHTGEEQSDYYMWFRQKPAAWVPSSTPTPEPKPIDKRLESMVEMKVGGNSLATIGVKHGISKERVRQLLFLTGVKFPRAKQLKKVLIASNNRCRFCNKRFIAQPPYRGRVFCSKDCQRAYNRRSQEQRPAKQKEAAKRWHQKHKNNPRYRRLIKLRNQGVKGLSIHSKNI